jgi:hypothetical protein
MKISQNLMRSQSVGFSLSIVFDGLSTQMFKIIKKYIYIIGILPPIGVSPQNPRQKDKVSSQGFLDLDLTTNMHT